MIELLVAIATSAVLCTALVGAMADTARLSTSGQNQIIAATIAQEQIDNVRDSLYSTIDNMSPYPQLSGNTGGNGSYTLMVDKTSSSQSSPSPTVNPRALLIDAVSFDWRTPTECTNNVTASACRATTEFSVQSVTQYVDVNPTTGTNVAPLTNTHQVWVQVKWTEGSATKTYTVGTLVALNGIHVY